ncbi:MAG: hypothetical protein RL885_06600 [Planctomycetota bacterium]
MRWRPPLATLLLAFTSVACQSAPEAHLESCSDPSAIAAIQWRSDRSYREVRCEAEQSSLRLEAPLNARVEDEKITGLLPGQFVILREERSEAILEASYREVDAGEFDWVVYDESGSHSPEALDRRWIRESLQHLRAHELLVQRSVDDLQGLIESGPAAYEEAFRKVASLTFTQDRIEVLGALARRVDLPAELQVGIVHFVLNEIAYSNDQMIVLQSLIENPGFCAEAQRTILEHVELLGFASDRRRLKRLLAPEDSLAAPVDG